MKKTSIMKSQETLEKYFNLINKKYYNGELPHVIITLQSQGRKKGVYGWITVQKVWEDNKKEKYEINISVEHLNRPFQEVINTLAHEMVHLYCLENDIKDTSRGGVYHNKKFRDESEKRGLIITQADKIGWSITSASKEFKQFVKENKERTDTFKIVRNTKYNDKSKKKQVSYRYECSICGGIARSTKALQLTCCNEIMLRETK